MDISLSIAGRGAFLLMLLHDVPDCLVAEIVPVAAGMPFRPFPVDRAGEVCFKFPVTCKVFGNGSFFVRWIPVHRIDDSLMV